MGFIARSSDSRLLDGPVVQAAFAAGTTVRMTHADSGMVREVFDVPAVQWPSIEDGMPEVRVIVTRSRLPSDMRHRVGRRIGDDGFELFVTSGPASSLHAVDVVALYLHRGQFEAALAREEIELPTRHWASDHLEGQRLWRSTSIGPSRGSDAPLDQRVLSLATEGVELFASTDHDRSADFSATITTLDLQSHIHWVRGDLITANGFGHFNVFPSAQSVVLKRDLPHLEPSAAQIVARARDVAPESIIHSSTGCGTPTPLATGPSSASTRTPAWRAHVEVYANHVMVAARDVTEPAQNGARMPRW